MTLTLMIALLCLGQDKPTKQESNELRELYVEALADADGKATKKLVAFGKKLTKKRSVEGVLEALADGPALPKGDPKPRGKGRDKEELAEYGTAWAGFRFEYDGESYGYAVDVPRRYDPRKPTALLIDPGHGSGVNQDQEGKAGFLSFYRGRVEASDLKGCLIARTEIVEQIGAGGVKGGWPEAETLPVWEQFLRDISSRFHVDPNRIYVTGLSQTGFWAWYLGRTMPGRFAGIAPMGAVTWEADKCPENFTALPVFVLHGDADEICPVAQPRAMAAKLEELGTPVEYLEVEGGEHSVSTWLKLNQGLDWLAEHGPRNPFPERIAKRLGSKEEPWCHWVRVTKLAKTNSGKAGDAPRAFLEAVRDGQRIELSTEGVRAVEVCLAPGMLDLDAPVTVVWNGKQVFEEVPELDLERALEVAVERADWAQPFAAFLELKAP